jgi:hypothetical protein
MLRRESLLPKSKYMIPDDFDSKTAIARLNSVFSGHTIRVEDSIEGSPTNGVFYNTPGSSVLTYMLPSLQNLIAKEGQEYEDSEKAALFILSEFFRCTKEYRGERGGVELWSACIRDNFLGLLPPSIKEYFKRFSKENLEYFEHSSDPSMIKVAAAIYCHKAKEMIGIDPKEAEIKGDALNEGLKFGSAFTAYNLYARSLKKEDKAKAAEYKEFLKHSDSPLSSYVNFPRFTTFKKYFDAMKNLADQGFTIAQESAAIMLERGEDKVRNGVKKPEEAREYYLKAAQNLSPSAIMKLAEFSYKEGNISDYDAWRKMLLDIEYKPEKEAAALVDNPLRLGLAAAASSESADTKLFSEVEGPSLLDEAEPEVSDAPAAGAGRGFTAAPREEDKKTDRPGTEITTDGRGAIKLTNPLSAVLRR